MKFQIGQITVIFNKSIEPFNDFNISLIPKFTDTMTGTFINLESFFVSAGGLSLFDQIPYCHLDCR